MSHHPAEGVEKVCLKVNPSREGATDEAVPQQAVAAVAALRECADARARNNGTFWYYQFLAELLKNGVLVRHMPQLNRDVVDNMLDVPTLDCAGFVVDYNKDATWRVITPQGKAIVMGEFAGSWSEP